MELPEPRWKFLIDAVEAAIGEDGDHIACAKLGRNSVDDGACVGQQLGLETFAVEGLDHVLRVQALGAGNTLLLVDAGQDYFVREVKAGDEFSLKNLAAQRVGAGFKHSPKA